MTVKKLGLEEKKTSLLCWPLVWLHIYRAVVKVRFHVSVYQLHSNLHTHKLLIATTKEICCTNLHLSKTTRSFSSILQCTEYGACVRALLIENGRSEIWMGWGMMEPDSFLSQTVTALSTPYCLRWHKSRPMVHGWGRGGGRAVVWGAMRLMFYAIRSTLLIVLARWDYFWRYSIDIALSSDMELRPLVFYDVFVCQSSLLPIYTSGALNTLRTGSFKLFKRPLPGFLTILTL